MPLIHKRSMFNSAVNIRDRRFCLNKKQLHCFYFNAEIIVQYISVNTLPLSLKCSSPLQNRNGWS